MPLLRLYSLVPMLMATASRVSKVMLRCSLDDGSGYVHYLSIICSLFVHYMFSHTLEKYWTSTGEVLDIYWTYTGATPLLLPWYYSLATKDSKGISKERLRRSKEAPPELTFAASSSLHVQTPGGNTCRLPRLQTLDLSTAIRCFSHSNTAFRQ